MASLSLSLRDYVGENELNYLQHRVGHHHVHVTDARHLARLLHPLLVAHHLRTVGLLALVETHLLLLLLPEAEAGIHLVASVDHLTVHLVLQLHRQQPRGARVGVHQVLDEPVEVLPHDQRVEGHVAWQRPQRRVPELRDGLAAQAERERLVADDEVVHAAHAVEVENAVLQLRRRQTHVARVEEGHLRRRQREQLLVQR